MGATSWRGKIFDDLGEGQRAGAQGPLNQRRSSKYQFA